MLRLQLIIYAAYKSFCADCTECMQGSGTRRPAINRLYMYVATPETSLWENGKFRITCLNIYRLNGCFKPGTSFAGQC